MNIDWCIWLFNHQGNAFIGQVEEDHRCAEHTDAAEHLYIQQMADADKRENEHLAKDTLAI